MILDVCRENPFAASMQRTGPTRSIGRGLARIEPSGERLVAYAAKEGTVAADGKGRNSPYSKALLAHLEEPGLEVGLMFRKVRDAVLAATGGAQEPFTYGSLSSRGAFLSSVPPAAASPAAAAPSPPGAGDAGGLNRDRLAARAYEAAERLHTVDAYEAVVERFPESIFADLARGQLHKLADGAPAETEPAGQATAAPTTPTPAAAPDPESIEASLGLERRDRRSIQAGLKSLGFDPGHADGLFGRKTRAALSAWQTAKGEAATGWLTEAAAETLKAAGEEARRKAKAERQARARAAMQPGTVCRDCGDCPEMVVVPAGSFLMGSPASEEGRDDDEGPQRQVTIPRPFAVGKYEVTFREWDSYTASGGCDGIRPGDAGWGGDRRPVIGVSWKDAKAYVAWLSQRTGKRYPLLSEAEWEYSARAGATDPFQFGNGISTRQANYNGNYTYGSGGKGLYRRKTVPVGSFPANNFGLHDLHGNVIEWVEDCWHANHDTGAPSGSRAWTFGGNCSRRVLRGGSWIDSPWVLRSASRFWGSTGRKSLSDGFRVARTVAP